METNIIIRHRILSDGDRWSILIDKRGRQDQIADFVDRPFALAGMAAAVKSLTTFFMADNLIVETADHTALARLASVGIAPLTAAASLIVKIGQHVDAGRHADACALVGGIDDDETYEAVIAAFPGLANYDAKGNYVGAVANENGWTA